MTLRHFLPGALLLAFLASRPAVQVARAAPEDPLLRGVSQAADALVTAMNRGDVAAALKSFDTNCLVTWCNAEISRGHAGVRAFAEGLRGGPVRQVEFFNCEIKVDDAPILLADGALAICSGLFNEQFKRPGGRKIDLQGRWTATLVQHDQGWLIANLQLSTDPFNNSLLNLAKQAGWVVGVVSILIGAGVGWMIGRRRNVSAGAS